MTAKQVKHPCRNCIYFGVCGDSVRTAPCEGRKTKREVKQERRGENENGKQLCEFN